MWGRFKRKVSRPSRDTESNIVVDQPPGENTEADIVLTGFRKLSSTYNAADLARSSSQNCLHNEDMTRSAGPIFDEPSSSCKCSPLMNFHKHLFGSLKGRQKATKLVSTNEIDLRRKSGESSEGKTDSSIEGLNDGSPLKPINGMRAFDGVDGQLTSDVVSAWRVLIQMSLQDPIWQTRLSGEMESR